MYEVELKAELTSEEKDTLIASFAERNFPFVKTTPQNDYYVHAEKSPYGGYDLKRYRDEGDKYIYTEKIWETIGSEKARKETEREISHEEFAAAIEKFPNAVKIKKERQWFAGSDNGENVSITIDIVKFDHSPHERYFIEAEMGTEEKEKVKEMKDRIRRFVQDLLGKTEINEAPGMFAMAFEKK